MSRNGAVRPRWVLRRDERRAGRYDGDKVVRWIASPTLMKGRRNSVGDAETEPSSAGSPERARPVSLRIVSGA